MLNISENATLEELTVDQLDNLLPHEVESFVENLESNTLWKDTEKNMMMNGAKMNCRK